MKQETSRILFNYWNDLRGPRPAPRRVEIEPARIAAILPDSFILERIGISCYRFRLAGTRICEQFGTELRGQNFLDAWNDEDRAVLAGRLAVMCADAAVALLEFEASADHRRVEFEVILTPLIQTGSKVDRILGAISPIDPHSWPAVERLGKRNLLRHELIWVSQSTAHAAKGASSEGSEPFERSARLVNVARRQFRVYDGGLMEPTKSRVPSEAET